MFNRTKTRTVHFNQPFTLTGLDGAQPAGDYQVREEEEQIEGLSWLAYRRISTEIEIFVGPKKLQLVTIDHEELAAAIELDRTVSAPPV